MFYYCMNAIYSIFEVKHNFCSITLFQLLVELGSMQTEHFENTFARILDNRLKTIWQIM